MGRIDELVDSIMMLSNMSAEGNVEGTASLGLGGECCRLERLRRGIGSAGYHT